MAAFVLHTEGQPLSMKFCLYDSREQYVVVVRLVRT
jgi:hypothetical protein